MSKENAPRAQDVLYAFRALRHTNIHPQVGSEWKGMKDRHKPTITSER